MLEAMDALWDKDKACYKEGAPTEFSLDSIPYQVSVDSLHLDDVDLDVFPTSKRIVTQVARDFGKPHDIVVPLLPGWAETSAQFEGDFLESLLRAFRQFGFKNPKVVGVNCSGRGSDEYNASPNRDRISRIGFQDEIDDAFKLAKALDEQGFLGDNMALVGHSMGVLNTMAFLDALVVEEDCNALRNDTAARVKKVVHLMPATDKPFGLLKPGFLWAVKTKVLPAIWQYLRNRGCLELTEDEHFTFMLNRENSFDMKHFEKGVPDSARRFLELTFNHKRRFAHLFKDGRMDGVDFNVVSGQWDNLIPSNTVHEWRSYLAANVGQVVNGYGMGAFDHSLPFKMNYHQKEQIDQLWERVFSHNKT